MMTQHAAPRQLQPYVGPALGLFSAFVRFPIEGTAYRFLPAGVEFFFGGFVQRGFEFTLDHGLAAQLVQAAPETTGQAGQVSGAQRGGLAHLRALDPSAEDVGLELHQEVVGDCATVHTQGFEAFAGVLLHGVQYVAGLVGNRLQGCTNDVINPYATGQAEQRATRIRVPIRRAQAGEGRDQVYAVAVFDLAGEVFGVGCIGDDLQLVTQPLYGGTTVEYRAFQGVGHFAAGAASDGGEHAVLGFDGLVAGVHQQEAAGAVSVLGLTRFYAHLAEQGRLLVTGDAADGDTAFGTAVDFRRRFDLRQHFARHVENLQHLRIPLQGVDVEEHGARGVGVIGNVGFAAGKFPDQPAVDGAEQQLAVARTLTAAFDVVEDPLQLGAGEVRVGDQAGGVADVLLVAITLELLADLGAASALPNDRVVDRTASDLVPDHGGFTLVGDTDGSDLVMVQAGLCQGLDHHRALGGEDFHRVMFNPA